MMNLSRYVMVVATVWCFAQLSARAELRTVALTSTDAPGTTDASFSEFEAPSLNIAGQTAFYGKLAGLGVNNNSDTGFWSEGTGTGLALVARTGDPAPGTAGAVFSSFTENPILNNAGQTALQGRLTGGDVNTDNVAGIWSEGGGGGLALVARSGDPVPGQTGLNYGGLSVSALNAAGQTAFSGTLSGPAVRNDNNSAIWSESGGSGPVMIAREGDLMPGAGGDEFSTLTATRPFINDAGLTVFLVGRDGFNFGSNRGQGIWRHDAVNGLSPIISSTSTSLRGLNSAGHAVFVEGGSQRPSVRREGYGSGLKLVARSREPAPGFPGESFSSFRSPIINDRSHTAFFGVLEAPSGFGGVGLSGVWSESPDGELKLIASEGGPAPGTDGATFTDFQVDTIFNTELALNRFGQVAFYAFLEGPDVNAGNDAGIWAQDVDGELKLIVREGDMIDVDNGPGVDTRRVFALEFRGSRGNAGGTLSGFNDLGQVAFKARLGFGQGVFVSDAVAVPEPSAALFAGIAVCGGLMCPRRMR